MASTRRALLLGLALASCAQGQSCSCLGTLQPLPSPLPPSAESQNGATLFVSTAGLDFFAQNVPTLVSTLLPQGLSFTVPSTPIQLGCIGTTCLVDEQICDPSACPYANAASCANGCPLDAAITGAQITGQSPDTLDVTLTVTIDSNQWGLNGSGACALGGTGGSCIDEVWVSGTPLACTIDLTLDQEPIEVPLIFSFDTISQALDVQPGAASVTLQGSDFDFTACGVAGQALDLVKGFLAQQLGTQLAKVVGPALETALNTLQCMPPGFYSQLVDGGACPVGSVVGTDSAGASVCANPTAGTCVARPDGLVGIGDLSTALAAEGAPPALAGISVFAGEAPNAGLPAVVAGPDAGLLLPLIDGFQALAPSSCAAPLPTPRIYATPAAIDFPLESARLGVRSYMLALGISQPFLQRAFDQAYVGGAFCLDIGGLGGASLSTTTLGALFPSLAELLPNEPLTLAFHPQQPPVVTIGADTVQNGQPQDPLITLTLPDVRVDALAALDGREVRAFAFTADLSIPFGVISASGGTSIQIVLGSGAQILGNIQGEESDLLGLSATTVTAQLQKFLPVAIGLAVAGLGNLPAIPLPSIQGFAPSVSGIGGIVPASDGGFSDIGLFLNLGQGSGAPTPPGFSARLVGSRLPTLNDVGPGGTLSAWPTQVFALQGPSEGSALEASYRIDDGPASTWRAGETLEIADPLLLLLGAHQIEIRVRPQGDLGVGDLTSLQIVSAFAPAAESAVAEPSAAGASVISPVAREPVGCATGGGFGAWLLVAASLLGVRRRRS